MKYKTIFFDADGTLLDFDAAERESLFSALRSQSSREFGEAELRAYHRINTELWEKLERKEIDSDRLHALRFERFVEAIGLPVQPDILGNTYLENLETIVFLIPGAIDLLKQLHHRVPMALISNGFARVQRSKIQITGIGKYFDAIVISGEVGFTKPDPGIFRVASEQIGGLEKTSTLMIGDSLTSDIQGGINYGIDTCLIDPGKKTVSPSPGPTYHVENLNELYEIIGLPTSR